MPEKIHSLDEIRAAVHMVAKRRGVERVFLFGSYARGQARPDSDVDLRIDCPPGTTLFDLGGIYGDLHDRLHKALDVVPTENLDSKFLSRIREEEVLLYEKEGL